MSSVPPTPRDRLELFCALVDDYDALSEAFPAEEHEFRFNDEPSSPTDHWHLVVRAVVLRKFVIAKQDQVHVSKVVSALAECARSEHTDGVVKTVRERFAGLHRWLEYDEGGAKVLTADELTEDLIYGGLLHGDYDRWQRVQGRHEMTHELATWQFVTGAEDHVRWLRDTIRAAEQEGLLDTPLKPGAP